MAASWVMDGARRQRLIPLPSQCAPEIEISDAYVEIVYGPLVGPTPLALARNLARRTTGASAPVHVDLLEVALELGLRASRHEPLGHTASTVKAVDRLEHRRLLAVLGEGLLGIYVTVPPLDDHYLDRLPRRARDFHRSYLERYGP